MVHQALRTRPLLVVAGLNELVVGNKIASGERLPDRGEDFSGRAGVAFYIFVEVESLVVRIDAAIIIANVRALPGRVLGIEHRRRAADEVAGVAEDVDPQGRVERRVVDVADERQDLFSLSHGDLRMNCGLV